LRDSLLHFLIIARNGIFVGAREYSFRVVNRTRRDAITALSKKCFQSVFGFQIFAGMKKRMAKVTQRFAFGLQQTFFRKR